MNNFSAIARPHIWGPCWGTLLAEYDARQSVPLDPLVELDDIQDELGVAEGGHHPFSYEAERRKRPQRTWKVQRTYQWK